MKIGVIFCCYGTPEYISPCLENWLKLKDKYNIKIAAVHGQFKEYHTNGVEDNDYDTQIKLKDLNFNKQIDYLYIQNDYNVFYPDSIKYNGYIFQTESEIRDKGLQYLLKENVDYIWLLDLDEFYTEEQIKSIIEYIDDGCNQFYCWWSIPMKNYIFSGKEYIKGFSPPRIFKTKFNDFLNLNKFYFDNDISYIRNPMNANVSYKELPNKKIPDSKIAGGVSHKTWLHSNGEQKVNYQIKHFNGICSYKFNKEKGELEFDKNYYIKYNIPIPEVYEDE